jgi:hypothetical protein
VGVACAWCGAVAEGPEVPLTWATSVEQGALRHYCERCAREHVRSIESRLDAPWWTG